eukprot:TRINITY_DN777942_c0_g1_i1.p1 TRINITY_DN777942_c0_g1~~TRINITY_DN777942_c0_g1_i1.p1  ORF type:complete len:117 (-),score=25.32 TRINITY_DN777942_c0_g1_i1:148-498(-)
MGHKKSLKDIAAVALERGSSPSKDDFPELADVLHYLKQIVAIVVGITWGIIGMTSAVGLISGCGTFTLVAFVYLSLYLKADMESYGGVFDLAKEGFFPAFGMFLLSWILSYSFCHV